MKLKKLFVFTLCLLLPFCFASCNFELQPDGFLNHSTDFETDYDNGGENTNGDSMTEYIDALTIIKEGNGESTYNSVQMLVNKLTTGIMNKLFLEYGESLLSKQRSTLDTHKNAIYQDGWLFAGPSEYLAVDDINRQQEWEGERIDKADYSLILKYNIYQILLNREVLDIGVTNLLSSDEYFILKSQGAFRKVISPASARKGGPKIRPRGGILIWN